MALKSPIIQHDDQLQTRSVKSVSHKELRLDCHSPAIEAKELTSMRSTTSLWRPAYALCRRATTTTLISQSAWCPSKQSTDSYLMSTSHFPSRLPSCF